MHLLHTLRQSRALARWVLLGWCMALGLAVAAPRVQPVQHALVCSASGALASQDTGAPDAPKAQHLDCVLCLSVGAPPLAWVAMALAAPESQLLSRSVAPSAAPRRSAAPPPGRGPPWA